MGISQVFDKLETEKKERRRKKEFEGQIVGRTVGSVVTSAACELYRMQKRTFAMTLLC
jgi:hypothetical protein